MKEKIEKIVNIRNRQAAFEFEFIETFVAGLSLRGTEIKSIRQGKVNLQDAYGVFKDDGLYVVNLHVSPYEAGTYNNHAPRRDRKLLLKKSELAKLGKKLQEQGLTIAVKRLFINDRGFAKLEVALARGKKLFDKRQDLKEKDAKRELNRIRL